MLKCEFDIIGISPLSFSKHIQTEKNTGESHDAFEERTWRERMHVNEKGMCFMPANFLKNTLSEVAKYLSESVKGKGKATFTKNFEAGVMVCDPMELNIRAADVPGETLFVPSDGKRGGTKRVLRTFPIITSWKTHAVLYVLDPLLIDKPEKILEYLEFAGQFIGFGRFRPRNNGYYGRFRIENFKTVKIK